MSKAQMLADEIESSVNNPHLYWQGKVAAELRRLDENVRVLREALLMHQSAKTIKDEIDAKVFGEMILEQTKEETR